MSKLLKDLVRRMDFARHLKFTERFFDGIELVI